MKNILAFGCDKEAKNEELCETWCGDQSICPTSEMQTDSSDAAYRAYAENLPGAGDHLSAERRKYFEKSARFCLSPHPNFEKNRSRGSDDGYYENEDTARLWWAFEAGINYSKTAKDKGHNEQN